MFLVSISSPGPVDRAVSMVLAYSCTSGSVSISALVSNAAFSAATSPSNVARLGIEATSALASNAVLSLPTSPSRVVTLLFKAINSAESARLTSVLVLLLPTLSNLPLSSFSSTLVA